MRGPALVAALAGLAACAAPPAGCTVALARVALPDAVRETSGAAWSRTRPGVWWTIDDGGNAPWLHAFDTTGAPVARVRVAGVAPRDWEDLAAGPCEDGTGDCLYLADIGDNAGERATVVIHRVAEPAPGDSVSGAVASIVLRYADGARDAEAFAVVPRAGDAPEGILVSKGRRTPIDVFTTTLRADTPHVLVPRRRLAPPPQASPDRVTGAGATPDGAWVAVRTYAELQLWRPDALLGDGVPARRIPLGALREPQGEAVAIAADGRVLLTSEGRPARASVLRCTLGKDDAGARRDAGG